MTNLEAASEWNAANQFWRLDVIRACGWTTKKTNKVMQSSLKWAQQQFSDLPLGAQNVIARHLSHLAEAR